MWQILDGTQADYYLIHFSFADTKTQEKFSASTKSITMSADQAAQIKKV
jgi:hypothetical protein